MVEQTDKTRIDQARSELRRALVEMAKVGQAVHGSPAPRFERPEQMHDVPLPRTPAELTGMLFNLGVLRAYRDLSAAAWQGRLSNADIERIERRAIAMLGEAADAADEFQTFEAEPAIAATQQQLRELFAGFAQGRIRQ